MYVQALLLLLLFIVPLPRTEAQSDAREHEVLRTLVFMRTEGLGMIELLSTHSKNKNTLELCHRIKRYYTETQPATVELCQGKDLRLSEEEVDLILGSLEKGFENYDAKKENDYLQLCEEHINKSIAFYTQLVQDRKWENLTYFSFTALPELFNLQQEIRKLTKR